MGDARRELELPTWGVAVAIHGGILAITLAYSHLPAPLALAALAWLVAWHGSLRHEVVHGHPSRRPWLNVLAAGPPWDLWLPLARYATWHRAHHESARLTDPRSDSESFYLTAADWNRFSRPARALVRAQQCLVGRLVLGPVHMVTTLWLRDIRAILTKSRGLCAIRARHLFLVAGVVCWLKLVAGLPLWLYALAVLWPANALQLLRSFDEYRPGHRSVMCRAEAPLALLFLNNNLHALHHAHPDVARYRLPALAREDGGWPGGYATAGYRRLAAWLWRAKDSPIHSDG